MALTATPQQQAIIAAVKELVESGRFGQAIKVAAFAGTGKTFTLKLVAEALPGLRILYLAFNKAIKEEAMRKFPANVTCKTAHGLAWGMSFKLGKNRVMWKTMPVIKGIEDSRFINPLLRYLGDERSPERTAAFAVFQTVARFCHGGYDEITDWNVPREFKIKFADNEKVQAEVVETLVEVARAVWADMSSEKGRLSITPDVVLKVYQLSKPQIPYDLILFDEAQDANGVMLALVNDQKRANIVFVGDRHQAIYGFRGAVNAMDKVAGVTLPLTESWRFGPEVAGQANVILRMLGETKPLTGGGAPGIVDDSIEDALTDAILARSNAGVLFETLAALDKGLKAAVVGGTTEVAYMLKSAYFLYCGKGTNHPELAVFKDWSEFVEFSETDEGASLRPTRKIVEEYNGGTLDLVRRLETETVSESEADVVISTAHKAKGREWDSVAFASDFKEFVTKDEENGRVSMRREEANLVYVSVTRAMKALRLRGFGEVIAHCARLIEEADEVVA
jgi:superfamily I DNA/RNA helicase